MGDSAGHADTRAVAISAQTGAGLDRLLATIDDLLPLDPIVRANLSLAPGDGATLALLHEFGKVVSIRYLDDGACEVEADIPESLKRRLPARS